MDAKNTTQRKPDWLTDRDWSGSIELSNREAVCLVLDDLDYDAQLATVHYQLRRNREANKALADEIKEIDAFARKSAGIRNEQAVDEWMQRIHDSVYQDAAHSMSAVGMLAPLLESIFYQSFLGIRSLLSERSALPPNHDRWSGAGADKWDCHFVWNGCHRSKNLMEGIEQLSQATGLSAHLPANLKLTLEALFEYRNKMFHHGFEWPEAERKRFQRRIDQSGWPADWFSNSTHGDEPWIYYLTDDFTAHCFKMIDGVLEGIGAFALMLCESRDGERATGGSI